MWTIHNSIHLVMKPPINKGFHSVSPGSSANHNSPFIQSGLLKPVNQKKGPGKAKFRQLRCLQWKHITANYLPPLPLHEARGALNLAVCYCLSLHCICNALYWFRNIALCIPRPLPG